MKNKILLVAVCVSMFAMTVVGQESTKTKTDMNELIESVYSADHKTVDSIIKATYDVISGTKEKKRDWTRFEALFHPDARLIPTGKNKSGMFVGQARTPSEYRKGSEPFFKKNGFFEQEIARRVDVFGHIAQVFSTYESRYTLDDKKPFMRGINSFQLFNDGKRWWVMTIYWQQESRETPIPEKYLTSVN
jgi:hypothetical protein